MSDSTTFPDLLRSKESNDNDETLDLRVLPEKPQIEEGNDCEIKKENDIPNSFPQLLMEILSNEDHADIISWLPHGNGFMIYKKKLFAARILPKYFKRSKFTSFTRKLNRWGFVRVTRGNEFGAYYHKFFKRGMTNLCNLCTHNKHANKFNMSGAWKKQEQDLSGNVDVNFMKTPPQSNITLMGSLSAAVNGLENVSSSMPFPSHLSIDKDPPSSSILATESSAVGLENIPSSMSFYSPSNVNNVSNQAISSLQNNQNSILLQDLQLLHQLQLQQLHLRQQQQLHAAEYFHQALAAKQNHFENSRTSLSEDHQNYDPNSLSYLQSSNGINHIPI